MCQLCENLVPTSEMVEVPVRIPKGLPLILRLCHRCASPRLTYIAGALKLTRVDVPRLLGLAFGLTIAVLNVAFGSIAGGQLGLFVAISGILCGAGVSLAFALSVAFPHGEPN